MPRQLTQKGFGLIEIMVGATIGIIASVIMFQTFALSERQKRTTTGSADAQSNGAIAMFMMERDIKMAGWGLQSSSFAGCSTLYTYHADTGAPLGFNILAPVSIKDGGDNPDSVTIQYYDDPANQGFKFAVTSLRSSMTQSSAEMSVNSTYGCQQDTTTGKYPLAIIQQGSQCTLMQITQVQDTALKLQHNSGSSGKYNPSTSYQNDNSWPSYTTGATLQCFPGLYQHTYQISSRQLELLQSVDTVVQTDQVAPEILDMQAQYGIASAGSQQINAWVSATGAWATPSVADARRIKAVRIALVARSAQYEKPEDGVTCAATTQTMADNWSTWATFNTSKLPSDWGCYRYKTYELVMPLRNIIWAKT